MTQQKEANRTISKPMVITDQSFDTVISKNKLVVVDFWAEWCGPCKQISPVMDELSREFSSRALFGKLNVDDSPQVPSRFHIRSIPTIMIFKGGIPVDQIVGFTPKSTIQKRIVSNL
jgi:thioredoxin 1